MNWSSVGNHPVMDPPLYKKIGDFSFSLEDVLGKGNFSTVFKGKHRSTG